MPIRDTNYRRRKGTGYVKRQYQGINSIPNFTDNEGGRPTPEQIEQAQQNQRDLKVRACTLQKMAEKRYGAAPITLKKAPWE